MHYYPHNIGDYRKDTSHLTLLEHGIYRQLLDSYYLDEMPLSNDLAKLMRSHSVRNADEQQALQNVLTDFFELTENGYIHKRCEDIIAKFHGKSESARASAMARWGRQNKDSNANALPTQSEGNANQEPITNNHKPITNNKNTIAKPEGLADLLWKDFLILRKSKKLPVTQTAFDGIKREAKKANKTLPEVIQICCERGWGGFKAEWLVIESLKTQDKPMQKWDSTLEGVMNKGKELGILPKPGETEGQYRERVRNGHK
jgi:uncharacterized protein YdaU (DUF1376 family)